MKEVHDRCNKTRQACEPGDIMSAASEGCSIIASPDGYSAEQLVYDQSYRDLINNFGYTIDYYLHTFNLSGADLLYGEQPTAVFYGPFPVKMYMELNNEAISLQSFGFDAADDFTGYVHIKAFEETLSSRDFFVQTISGDILPIADYVKEFAPETNTVNFITENGNDLVFETLIESDDLYDQSGETYTVLNNFIETNHKLEPKSGDLIDFVQLGCDRPGDRCSKIFQITERMDQDLAGGLNPMLGHYVWRLRAKRYEHSFEPGAPIECENEQVFDNSHNGVTDTNIATDTVDEPKSYPGDIDQQSKDIYDMDVNDSDIYGSYY